MITAGFILGLIFLVVFLVITFQVVRGHMTSVIRMWEWKEGTRWIRFFPNPGFKVVKGWRWSKFYGRGKH